MPRPLNSAAQWKGFGQLFQCLLPKIAMFIQQVFSQALMLGIGIICVLQAVFGFVRQAGSE
ncbi:hypothetical protein D3C87_1245860 [compost metagenome]